MNLERSITKSYQSDFSKRINDLVIHSNQIERQIEEGYRYGYYVIKPYNHNPKNDNQRAIRLIDISFYRLYFEINFAKNILHFTKAWERHKDEVALVIAIYKNIDDTFLENWIHDYVIQVSELVVRLKKYRPKSFSKKLLNSIELGIGVGTSAGIGINIKTNIKVLKEILDEVNILKDFEDLITKLNAKQDVFPQYAQRNEYMSDIELKIETSFGLSEGQVKKIIKENDFFDKYKNPSGKGIQHKYEERKISGEKVVIDESIGLMWQQGGSSRWLGYKEAKEWVKELNQKGYAGFNDWRFPTLEEAMSLIEPEEKSDLYIDPIFDSKQKWIWTADQMKGDSKVWVVSFYGGSCLLYLLFGHYSYIRAVRS